MYVQSSAIQIACIVIQLSDHYYHHRLAFTCHKEAAAVTCIPQVAVHRTALWVLAVPVPPSSNASQLTVKTNTTNSDITQMLKIKLLRYRQLRSSNTSTIADV